MSHRPLRLAGTRTILRVPHWRHLLIWSAGAVLATTAAAVSTIELRSGASVSGDILVEKADRLVVDLGYTVIEIPRDEVTRVVAESTEEGGQDVVEASGDLYRTASNQPVLPVKQNVDRVAEAVVQVRTPVGLGSGFIIHRDGYVVTNHHVISGEYDISITQYKNGGSNLERVAYSKVRIVALDARLDLALLKIETPEPQTFPTVPLGDSQSVGEGQTVFAIGSPLGLERTVSQGIISLRNRALGGLLYLQTTTQINPGNSGGPLFNLRGEVVGVNNMKPMMTGIEGLNFAIPVSVLKTFIINRDAYAFDPRNPNAGFRYLQPSSFPREDLDGTTP